MKDTLLIFVKNIIRGHVKTRLAATVGDTRAIWQIGPVGMSAKVQDMAGGLGTGATAEVGINISLKAFDVVPMFEYTGDLPVTGV
jgi:hypothetical protein